MCKRSLTCDVFYTLCKKLSVLSRVGFPDSNSWGIGMSENYKKKLMYCYEAWYSDNPLLRCLSAVQWRECNFMSSHKLESYWAKQLGNWKRSPCVDCRLILINWIKQNIYLTIWFISWYHFIIFDLDTNQQNVFGWCIAVFWSHIWSNKAKQSSSWY